MVAGSNPAPATRSGRFSRSPAYAHCVDQRFRDRQWTLSAGLSGVFLGTYSSLAYAAHARWRYLEWPAPCAFAAEAWCEAAPHRAALCMPYAAAYSTLKTSPWWRLEVTPLRDTGDQSGGEQLEGRPTGTGSTTDPCPLPLGGAAGKGAGIAGRHREVRFGGRGRRRCRLHGGADRCTCHGESGRKNTQQSLVEHFADHMFRWPLEVLGSGSFAGAASSPHADQTRQVPPSCAWCSTLAVGRKRRQLSSLHSCLPQRSAVALS